MLGYATPSPVANRRFSPATVSVIVVAHAILLGIAMTAKMATSPPSDPLTKIHWVPQPLPPPPNTRTPTKPTGHPTTRSIEHTVVQPRIINVAIGPKLDSGPTIASLPIDTGPITLPPPYTPPHQIVRQGPQIATAEGDLRPPYPASKRRLGEEATLPLRLTIAPDGRVIAVQADGPVDPVFFEAARRHILGHWRYRPATEDGQPVATTISVRLQFKLEGEA